ncbi:hypothetical protein [Bacteroides pyogenes]|nr:hypothetical protein [Bacteroides pyogenes]MBB3894142.1 hypothetical protein [Bacteroides pyogenes]
MDKRSVENFVKEGVFGTTFSILLLRGEQQSPVFIPLRESFTSVADI